MDCHNKSAIGNVSDRSHRPVLPAEVIEALNLSPGKTVIDGTLGLGGHSIEILKLISPNGRLIGVDLDKNALGIAKEKLAEYKNNIDLFSDNFANIGNILKELNIDGVDGILLDLGMSSYQLSDETRGFSFLADGPLDMRMSEDSSTGAADIINRYPEDDLVRIFSEYGEERFSRRIARKIVLVRKIKPIEKAGELSGIIKSAVPFTHSRVHPATRVFQALRIEVNSELESLKLFLKEADKYLNANGRLAVISFHSLEDRLVKRAFIEKKINNLFRIITKKPIIPSAEEIKGNLRSRSAKLRVAEKI